jgi:Fe-S oxidoreductase
MDVLDPLLDQRTYLVGVEPSCLSVFRDEIKNLFPQDPRANKIAEKTMTLGAFLQKHGSPDIHIDRDIMVHGHCHQKSILGIDDDTALLKKAGRKVEMLDSGCCGMAGAFGYERHKYEVSETIAEQRLMPAVRAASPQTLIVADGFSCRSQIAHFTNRRALTLPEVLLHSLKGESYDNR